MKDLIEALNIFLKYSQKEYPTYCEHESFDVIVDPSIVSVEDIKRLDELGFTADKDAEMFYSFRFGG